MKIIAILLLLNAPSSMAMENQEKMNDEGLKRTYSQAFPDEEKACFKEQTKKHCAELCSFGSAKEELALVKERAKNALAVLEKEAKAGCPKANFSLGKFYEKGQWVEVDRYKASLYFEVAANGGHVGALYHLGKYQIYEVEQLRNKGISNEMNEFLTQGGYNRAVKYFQQAAMKGHLTASFTLGQMYHRGTGVQKDLRQAERFYDIAARQGDIKSAKILADMYDEDGELPLNHERCLELYQFLASKGYLHAMVCLGHFYANGWGTPKDDRMAAEYNNRAYLHGDGEGGTSLAYMYREGEGVPQDLAKSQQYVFLPSPSSN